MPVSVASYARTPDITRRGETFGAGCDSQKRVALGFVTAVGLIAQSPPSHGDKLSSCEYGLCQVPSAIIWLAFNLLTFADGRYVNAAGGDMVFTSAIYFVAG